MLTPLEKKPKALTMMVKERPVKVMPMSKTESPPPLLINSILLFI